MKSFWFILLLGNGLLSSKGLAVEVGFVSLTGAGRHNRQGPSTDGNGGSSCASSIISSRRHRRLVPSATTSRSSLLLQSPQCRFSSHTLFAVPEGSVVVTEGALWALRIASAVVSYVAFVAFFDRPRGQLHVQLEEQIEIKQSTVPGAGLGLFAKTSLPAGTVLGTYPGTVIPLNQNLSKLRKYPACEGYVWRFSDNQFVIDPTNEMGVLDDTCLGGNPSMPGSVALFRTFLRFFPSVSTALCRINEPPKGMDVNVVTSEDLEKRSVTFELERDVMEKEEFFIDYGLSYDRSMYGGSPKD